MNPSNTKNSRRHLLMWTASLCLGATAGLHTTAHAQDAWPSKPLRLIVPFTPGGVTDTSGRLIAESLGKRLGQQVVVDNKPGASGNIGTALAKGSAPDGYTLVLGFDGTMVINPHVFSKLPFDPVKDFAPIGKIGDATLILVANPNVPAKSLLDVVNLSKSTAGGLSFGTSGTGGTPHIAGELLKMRTGANLTHTPYKGGGQAMTDVMGGSIPLVYTAVAGAQGHVKSGKPKSPPSMPSRAIPPPCCRTCRVSACTVPVASPACRPSTAWPMTACASRWTAWT